MASITHSTPLAGACRALSVAKKRQSRRRVKLNGHPTDVKQRSGDARTAPHAFILHQRNGVGPQIVVVGVHDFYGYEVADFDAGRIVQKHRAVNLGSVPG